MCVTLVRECLLLKNRYSKHPYREQESRSHGIQWNGGKDDISLFIPPTDHLFKEMYGRGKASLEWEAGGRNGAWPGLCAAEGGSLLCPQSKGICAKPKDAGRREPLEHRGAFCSSFLCFVPQNTLTGGRELSLQPWLLFPLIPSKLLLPSTASPARCSPGLWRVRDLHLRCWKCFAVFSRTPGLGVWKCSLSSDK